MNCNRYRLIGATCWAALQWASVVHAEDPVEESAEAQAIAAQVASMRVEPQDPALTDQFTISDRKLLSYSDPARGYSTAGLWRIGETGRPRAFICVEYWNAQADAPARVSMEFLSLTDDAFSLFDSRQLLWSPEAGDVEFRELAGLAKPADADRTRLRQLKSIAQRFSMSEQIDGKPYVLRLLPNPIERYADPDQEIVDGAAFAFAYGTNPEAILLIEATGDGWQYAVAHTTSIEVVVSYDGMEVFRIAEVYGSARTAPHSGDAYEIVESTQGSR
jgi:hypothetical protein